MKKLLAILVLAFAAWATPDVARADIVFANTTGGRLISFDSATPGSILNNVAISGVLGDLVGIDERKEAQREVYGEAYNLEILRLHPSALGENCAAAREGAPAPRPLGPAETRFARLLRQPNPPPATDHYLCSADRPVGEGAVHAVRAVQPEGRLSWIEAAWSSRDLRALIETHWTRPDAAYYEGQAVLGDLGQLDAPSVTATVGRGGSDQVRAILDGIRAEDPDEPMWTGVDSIEPEGAGARVHFREADSPALRPAGGVEVAESSVLLDTAVADDHDAELLGVQVGDPLVLIEQIIFGAHGRPVGRGVRGGEVGHGTRGPGRRPGHEPGRARLLRYPGQPQPVRHPVPGAGRQEAGDPGPPGGPVRGDAGRG